MKNVIDFIENNKYTIIGHLVFLTSLAFAVIYDRERVFITDPAGQLTQMICTGRSFISFGRVSMTIAHLLPLILIWANAPLHSIVLGYSLSFILLGYIIYIIAVHVLKNKAAGIVIVSAVLLEYHIFFHAVAETVQMMYFCTLLIAWLKHSSQTNKMSTVLYYIGLIIIVFLCVNIHPAAIFPTAFIICYDFIDKSMKIDKKLIVCSIAFVAFEILKSFIITEKYETNFFDFDNMMDAASNFLSLCIFQKFIAYTFFQVPLLYFIPMILLLFCVLFYAKKRLWIKLAFIIVSNLAFLFVNILIYSTADGYNIGTFERMFMPLIIFTMLPFANDVLPSLNKKQETIFVGMFSMSLLFSFIGISHVSNVYTSRLQEMEKIIKVAHAENKHKLFIKHTPTTEKLLSVWTGGVYDVPKVSVLLSAIDGPENTVTMYFDEPNYHEKPSYMLRQECYTYNPNHTNDIIFTDTECEFIWAQNNFNSKYFNIPEEQYCEIKYQNGEYYIVNIKQ